jgi:hypothetical protein
MSIERLEVSAYRILTERTEADGTFQWDSTTMVLVEAIADSGQRGLGFTIEDHKICGDVLEEALNAPGPVIVDAVVDPFEPPKVSPEQVLKFAKSLAKGQPKRMKIAATIAEDVVKEMI